MAEYIRKDELIRLIQKMKPAIITPADEDVAADAFDEQFDRAAQSAALGVRFEEDGDDGTKSAEC